MEVAGSIRDGFWEVALHEVALSFSCGFQGVAGAKVAKTINDGVQGAAGDEVMEVAWTISDGFSVVNCVVHRHYYYFMFLVVQVELKLAQVLELKQIKPFLRSFVSGVCSDCLNPYVVCPLTSLNEE